MKFLPMILRNLLRSRRRSILTVLSIAVSIFLFATLMSLPSVFHQLLRDQVSELRLVCANKAGYLYTLPESYGNSIATMPHVDASSGYIATIAKYRGPRDQIPVMGIEPTALRTLRPEWVIAPEAASALAEIRGAGLVSTQLAARHNWKVGDTVVLHLAMLLFGDLPIKIVGTVDDGGLGMVIVPLERLDKLGVYKNGVFAYMVKVDRSEKCLACRSRDRRALR